MAAFDHNGLPGSALDRELRGLNCVRCDRLSNDLTAAQSELERVRDKCNEHYMALAAAQSELASVKAHAEAMHNKSRRVVNGHEQVAAIEALEAALVAYRRDFPRTP